MPARGILLFSTCLVSAPVDVLRQWKRKTDAGTAINKSPMMLNQQKQAQDLEAGVIKTYNGMLASRLSNFTAANKGIRGVVVDTQAPFNAALSNPTKYGSKDATCYNSDGKTCLWFNDYHPGLVGFPFYDHSTV